MHIVFFSTSDVFKAEEILNENGIACKVVPTPVQDKAYCGVCILVDDGTELEELSCLEYERIEG
jgi:hypothetical protein